MNAIDFLNIGACGEGNGDSVTGSPGLKCMKKPEAPGFEKHILTSLKFRGLILDI